MATAAAAAEECPTSEEKETSEVVKIEDITYRVVSKQFDAHTQSEGAGFIVNRPIGSYHLSDKEADPFLLLDELGPKIYKVGEFEGAPWHPHRGFDTVMYIRHGKGTHQDSMGNRGTLNPGDVQWMTAGRGIIHDEGRDHPGGLLHGFQLWCNLPAKHKMIDPMYQTMTADKFPFIVLKAGSEEASGTSDTSPSKKKKSSGESVPETSPVLPKGSVRAKAIAGQIMDQSGKVLVTAPVNPLQRIEYYDYEFGPDASFTHVFGIEADQLETVILYTYSGSGQVYSGKGDPTDASSSSKRDWISLRRKRTVLFSKTGNAIHVRSNPKDQLSFLLLCGVPIKEPIARYGPFVMNTEAEIRQCFEDYRNGTLATVKGKEKLTGL